MLAICILKHGTIWCRVCAVANVSSAISALISRRLIPGAIKVLIWRRLISSDIYTRICLKLIYCAIAALICCRLILKAIICRRLILGVIGALIVWRLILGAIIKALVCRRFCAISRTISAVERWLDRTIAAFISRSICYGVYLCRVINITCDVCTRIRRIVTCDVCTRIRRIVIIIIRQPPVHATTQLNRTSWRQMYNQPSIQ
mmetsp:Transcript_113124/g.284478  ORF Transcript_113124/g.284478 Transcript_113124/m.284478 type:complete len:203 (-) Transcript_113124:147-755(-)